MKSICLRNSIRISRFCIICNVSGIVLNSRYLNSIMQNCTNIINEILFGPPWWICYHHSPEGGR